MIFCVGFFLFLVLKPVVGEVESTAETVLLVCRYLASFTRLCMAFKVKLTQSVARGRQGSMEVVFSTVEMEDTNDFLDGIELHSVETTTKFDKYKDLIVKTEDLGAAKDSVAEPQANEEGVSLDIDSGKTREASASR